MKTTFADWVHGADYNSLDTTGRYIHGGGVIPSGTVVQFMADDELGTVVHGNSERSLVSYRPDPLTGCSEARDWFGNSELRVPVVVAAGPPWPVLASEGPQQTATTPERTVIL